jgi:DNA-binding NarL/FixJ family response regulator
MTDVESKTDPRDRTSVKKIVIVDDHPILRKGLSMLINQEADLAVAGEAGDARRAMEVIENIKPDMVIVDISLPGVDGVELIKNIKLKYGDLPALVVSMHDEALFAERALRSGARGYIMKQEAVEKVLVAIRRILAGEIFVSSAIATKMLEKLVEGESKNAASPLDLLSDRELSVFQLIGRGMGTRQIAEELHLSVKTIESYRSHIKEKLRLTSGMDLLTYAIQWTHKGN